MSRIQITRAELIRDDGKSFIVTDAIIAMNIFESLFSTALTASVVMLDTENLQEVLPIVGREHFSVEYTNDSEPHLVYFDVISINDIKSKNQETKTFELKLASIHMLPNNNITLQRRFSGSTSAIIKEILLNDFGMSEELIKVEATNDYVNMLPPNFTPLKFINWLSANIGDSDRSSYYLYETTKGMRFYSLEQMLEYPSVGILSYADAKHNSIREPDRILNYTLSERFDSLKNLSQGNYAGKVYTHDIINKTLNKTVLWNPNQASLSYRTDYLPESSITLTNHVDPVAILNRGFTKGDMSHNKLLIEIQGNSDLEVGHKVTIKIPSTAKQGTSVDDEVLSGDYIVVKIKHTMTQEAYNMIVELNKYDQ